MCPCLPDADLWLLAMQSDGGAPGLGFAPLQVETAIEAGRAGKDPKGIAGAVVKLAYERGSTDNISVVACLLHARPAAE